jgi:phosphoglycerate dehydrogenase-like enzyme
MTDKLRIVVNYDNPEIHTAARALSDRIETIDAAAYKADPSVLGTADIAYGWFNGEEIESAPNLRWVQMSGAGANRLLTPGVIAGDVVITNVSGVHAEPITEHMFGMLLMTTRRLGHAWDAQKEHRWVRQSDFVAESTYGDTIAGMTLGVLGVGAIGGHSARVGKAFGMRVIGLRRSGEPHTDVERMYTPDERHAFLAECDVVMNVLPLTDKTHAFLGRAEFDAIKRGCIVINTGRGPTIDTGALIDALHSGKVGAALLDVTDPEPLPDEHPLWSAPNVFITAHYSGSHARYFEKANKIFLHNLRRYLAGEPLVNVVDKAEGY